MPPLWIEPGLRLPLGRSTILPEGSDASRLSGIEDLLRGRGFRPIPGGILAPPADTSSFDRAIVNGLFAERYNGALPASDAMRRTMALLMLCGVALAATEFFLTYSLIASLIWILAMGGMVFLFWAWVGRGCETDLVGVLVEWRPEIRGGGRVWAPREIRWRAGRIRSEVRIGGRLVSGVEAPPELVNLLVSLATGFEPGAGDERPLKTDGRELSATGNL
jgi:hypothetical protein